MFPYRDKLLMRTLLKLNVFLIASVVGMLLAGSLQAAVIYANSTNDLVTRFNPGTTEVGDQIMLAGTERMLTSFSFEFWGTNTANPTSFAGTIQARVRFYENNGDPFNGYLAPGTNFFDSGWFSVLSPTERSTFIFTAGSDFPSWGLFIPADEMTWSVEFSGMGGTDSVGVDLYSPPTVGQNYDDYWSYSGSSWTLQTNSVATMSFGAYMEAVVPEPSTVTLSIMGGLGMLLLTRRLRREK